MTPTAYNVSVAAGLSSFGAGMYMVAGVGFALIGVGMLVLALTIFGVTVTRQS
jgi:hypothetical protein